MRLLANENFPRDAVEALRAASHDVAWVRTIAPGISDREVLALAEAEDRLLLTFDKDFGELAFRSGLSAASGVILFRALAPSPALLARLAVRVLQSRSDWAGHFSVIENDRIRMTPLPFTTKDE
jgi:predicted nuclease of predicted toxin-antitoxin system